MIRSEAEKSNHAAHVAPPGKADILPRMDGSTRWIAIAAVLGLCVAYALWGGRAATQPAPDITAPIAPDPKNKIIDPNAPPTVTPPLAAPTSALKMTPETVDFGDVKVTEHKEVVVQVMNSGKELIKIDDVKGSCGCLKVDMPDRSIEPGKSATLKLGFTGQSGKRPESYSVSVITNEEGRPKVILPVKGKVIQTFIVDPVTLYFEDGAKGVAKTQETVITRVDGKPFNIKAVSAQHKELSFKWEPVAGSNASAYKIFVTLTGIEPCSFTEGAAILTDHPTVPAMPIHIGARVTGDVVSTTQVLTAVQGMDTRVAPFETVIKRVTPGPLEIKSIEESDKRPIEVTQTRIDESSIRVKVTLTSEFPDKTPFGDFVIYSNVEAQPLRVPYRVVRRGAQIINSPGAPPETKVLRP